MRIKHRIRQGHEARAVRPDQRAFHNTPRKCCTQQRAIGRHLSQIKWRHIRHLFRRRAIGLVIQHQHAVRFHLQPVHLACNQPAIDLTRQGRFGQAARVSAT